MVITPSSQQSAMKMKVAIVGCGSGAVACAGELSQNGHDVNLFEFPEFKGNIEPILHAVGR